MYLRDICAAIHNPVLEDKTNITFFQEKLKSAFDIKASSRSISVYFSLKTLCEIYLFLKSFFELIVSYLSVKNDL